MYYTYSNCYNLTGSPVCGNNVREMQNTYHNCRNLTGSPACGNNVTNMYQTYYNCQNLTGSPVCGNNVFNMYRTYYNCKNIGANAYFYSPEISSVAGCFELKNNSRRLNIYVPANSNTVNKVINGSRSSSLVYNSISYTNSGTYYYSTTYNIYIYPVEDVAAKRLENEFNVTRWIPDEYSNDITIDIDTVFAQMIKTYSPTSFAVSTGKACSISIPASLPNITIETMEVI